MSDSPFPQPARRLRIYINEGDHWHGKPLEAALLDVLREHGAAGATLFRGAAGFGAHRRVHTTSIEVLAFDLPVVIEVIDTPEKAAALLEVIAPMVAKGLITGEDVQVLLYHRPPS